MTPASTKTLLYVFANRRNFSGHWLDRVRAAAERGWDVHVALPPGPPVEADVSGLTLHTFPIVRGYAGFFRELRTAWGLYKLLWTLKPDLVHAITIKPLLLTGVLARFAGIKAQVFSMTGLGHTFFAEAAGHLISLVAHMGSRFIIKNRPAQVVFENADDRQFFVRAGLADMEQCHVFVGGGLDLSEYRFIPEPESEESIVVLCARMMVSKGVYEFIEAARHLRAQGVKARFVLVGEPDPCNPLTVLPQELEDWEQEEGIEYWGWRDDMVNVLAGASIVCLPSWREGAPRTLMEAAALGRACVTTDAPGCRDVVVEGKTGLLVPVRDSDALAAALKTLIEDPQKRQRMGQAARSHAEQHFSSALAIKRLFGVYEALLGPAPPAPRQKLSQKKA